MIKNLYQFIIGMFFVGLLATTKFVRVKGKTFDSLKNKIEYRINKMS